MLILITIVEGFMDRRVTGRVREVSVVQIRGVCCLISELHRSTEIYVVVTRVTPTGS